MAGLIRQTPAAAIGLICGGFGVMFLIGALAIGILIMSLIPLYTPDNSVPGYGEIYRISGLTLKAIYSNISANFTGGSVLNLQELSAACSAIFRAKNVRNFYACVASNFSAYGPSGNTNISSVARRRREYLDVAVYEVGDMLILFSNTCDNRRALRQWFPRLTWRQNSSCVAQRATACQAFVTNPNTGIGGSQWSPFPPGFTQLIVNNVTSCAPIAIGSMYNVPVSLIGGVSYNYNISRPLQFVPGGVMYDSIVPQSTLQYMVSSLLSTNQSVCSSYYG